MADPTAPNELRKKADRGGGSGAGVRVPEARPRPAAEPRPKSSAPRTSAARRREARRQMPDRFASLWAWLAWFRHRHVVSAACFVLLFTLVGGLLAHFRSPARTTTPARSWTRPASPASASPP